MAFNLGDALKAVSAAGTDREQIEYIELNRIEEDPRNFYLLSGIDELAANIELCGLQQPLRVRPIEGTDRFVLVSGHRRRAAIAALAQEDADRWNQVACIVERDAISPTLQQLRLIYANAHTRKMTPAETSRQAEEVTSLLYQLKEEGYEFPGRMRDHVAEAVGVSKSKLARLKVIRENLDPSWVDAWEDGTLTEAQAYALAQMPGFWQYIIKTNWKYSVASLYADSITRIRDKFQNVHNIQCHYGLQVCEHTASMMAKLSKESYLTPCTGCCFGCSDLASCKNCCPQAFEKQKELKAADKAEKREAKQHQEDLERPGAEFAKMVYQRIGEAKTQNDVSIETFTKARGVFYSAAVDNPKQLTMESGDGKYSPNTYLPLGISLRAADLMQVVEVADTLQCSVDYLLGRTDRMEIAPEADTIWHPISEEPPIGEVLVWVDKDGYADTGKYMGDHQIQRGCCVIYDEAMFWAYRPNLPEVK